MLNRTAWLRASALVTVTTAGAAVPATLTVQAWHGVRAAGPATLDAALTLLVGAAATIAALWLVVAVAASAAAALSGGRPGAARVRRLAGGIAPWPVRRLVTVLVTASLMAPAAAQAATATGSPPGTDPGGRPAASALTDPSLVPSWIDGALPATTVVPSHASAHSPTAVPGQVSVPSPTAVPVPAVTSAAGRGPAPAPALEPGWLPSPVATGPKTVTVLAPPGPALRAGALGQDEVVVRRGDTLWDIAARRLGPGATHAQVLAAWPAWFVANRDRIGTDPDLIRPGLRLRPPSTHPSSATGVQP